MTFEKLIIEDSVVFYVDDPHSSPCSGMWRKRRCSIESLVESTKIVFAFESRYG